MSAHGINDVTLALLDDNGKIIADAAKGLSASGIYVADHSQEGFTTANITGIEAAGTIQWANNKPKFTSYGKSTPSVALTALELDHAILMKIKGFVPDGKGGYTRKLPKPHVAMLIHSESMNHEVNIYEGFANCEIVEPDSSHSTDNTAESDAATTLTASVLAPLDPTVFGGEQYKIWFDNDTGFAEADMMKEVFGGYVATTTPAGS